MSDYTRYQMMEVMPAQLLALEQNHGRVRGMPTYFAIVAGQMRVFPEPSEGFTVMREPITGRAYAARGPFPWGEFPADDDVITVVSDGNVWRRV